MLSAACAIFSASVWSTARRPNEESVAKHYIPAKPRMPHPRSFELKGTVAFLLSELPLDSTQASALEDVLAVVRGWLRSRSRSNDGCFALQVVLRRMNNRAKRQS